jgi:plasmid stabilization system protein ParE
MADVYRVNLSSRAIADLAAILEYIATESAPDQAAAVIENIKGQIDGLRRLPGRFKSVGLSRRNRHPIHLLVVSPYLVYYRISEARSAVFVVTVRHGRRRQLRSFD